MLSASFYLVSQLCAGCLPILQNLLSEVYILRMSFADPTNAAIIVENGGIPQIIQCLSSPVENTV